MVPKPIVPPDAEDADDPPTEVESDTDGDSDSGEGGLPMGPTKWTPGRDLVRQKEIYISLRRDLSLRRDPSRFALSDWLIPSDLTRPVIG